MKMWMFEGKYRFITTVSDPHTNEKCGLPLALFVPHPMGEETLSLWMENGEPKGTITNAAGDVTAIEDAETFGNRLNFRLRRGEHVNWCNMWLTSEGLKGTSVMGGDGYLWPLKFSSSREIMGFEGKIPFEITLRDPHTAEYNGEPCTRLKGMPEGKGILILKKEEQGISGRMELSDRTLELEEIETFGNRINFAVPHEDGRMWYNLRMIDRKLEGVLFGYPYHFAWPLYLDCTKINE